MRRLPHAFRADGFDFHQVTRQGRVALFEKRKRAEGAASFEVVNVQQRPAERAFGVDYPPRETMPASEQWGRDGFTYCDIASARERFNRLANGRECPALFNGSAPGTFSARGRGRTATRHPKRPREARTPSQSAERSTPQHGAALRLRDLRGAPPASNKTSNKTNPEKVNP